MLPLQRAALLPLNPRFQADVKRLRQLIGINLEAGIQSDQAELEFRGRMKDKKLQQDFYGGVRAVLRKARLTSDWDGFVRNYVLYSKMEVPADNFGFYLEENELGDPELIIRISPATSLEDLKRTWPKIKQLYPEFHKDKSAPNLNKVLSWRKQRLEGKPYAAIIDAEVESKETLGEPVTDSDHDENRYSQAVNRLNRAISDIYSTG